MAILVITVDLQCCRCRAKITNVLDCLKEEFCIEKVEFEDKTNKVVVRGKFNAEKLRQKVWCKACKVVKEIIIVEVWPPPPPPQPKKPQPPPPPPPQKTEYKLVPYSYPVPYPVACQSYPWTCPPQQQGHCRPNPPAKPPCECSSHDHHHGHGGCSCGGGKPPPPCGCSSHAECRCGRAPAAWPAPPLWPPPWGECKLVTDENQCSIM